MKNLLLAIATLLVTGFGAHAQEITFQATVDRNEIAAGDPLKLTITLSNATAGGGITTPDFAGLVVLQGPMESRNMMNFNGRVSGTTSRSWYLTATRPGSYVIGPSTARVGGGVLQTEPITITV